MIMRRKPLPRRVPYPVPLLPLDEEESQTPVESGELRKNPALLWEIAAPSYLRQQAQTTGTARQHRVQSTYPQI
jgi:hypothetical protein